MAATTISATRLRTAKIRTFTRVGWTRFVSRMMNKSLSGSIQIDVPVNPVCPNATAVSFVPALEPGDGVSQPRAREEPGGRSARTTNERTRLGLTGSREHGAVRAGESRVSGVHRLVLLRAPCSVIRPSND